MNCEKFVFQILRLCAGIGLIFALGCGGGSMTSTTNSNSQTPATSSTSPGGTSASSSSPGSSNSGSSTGSGSSAGGSSSGSSSSGTNPPSQPAGFLYVALNDGYSIWTNVSSFGHGSIAGFTIGADGTLQTTPGSPYAGPAASLASNSAASTLYAASQSTLNVNRINPDGSLITTATFNAQPLTPSIGIYEDLSFNPVSQFLYAVAIHGAGDNFFEIYQTAGDGSLKADGSQQISVSAAHPSFTPDGGRAYEPYCYHLDGRIIGYNSTASGQLAAFNANAAIPNLGTQYPACPIALSISSDGSRVVAQLNAIQGSTAAALAVYTINADGTLNQGSLATTTAQGSDVAWDRSGKYIAVAAKDGLWLYNAAPGATPVSIGGAPIAAGPIDHLAFNKAGTLLFASNSSTQSLYVFAFNSTSGTVTPAPGSPHQLNLPPYALALSER